jgi:predicted transcriptional regulator
MAWDWLKTIIGKIAAEVHKTKIGEFENRLLEIERKQEVILKSIQDSQNKLEKLDDRIYQANIESAAAVGAIKTVIQGGMTNYNLLNQDLKNDNSANKK